MKKENKIYYNLDYIDLSVKNKIVENEIAILLMEEFTIEKKEGK